MRLATISCDAHTADGAFCYVIAFKRSAMSILARFDSDAVPHSNKAQACSDNAPKGTKALGGAVEDDADRLAEFTHLPVPYRGFVR